jgi:hypothetical protein
MSPFAGDRNAKVWHCDWPGRGPDHGIDHHIPAHSDKNAK